jgi:CheY-like chemotaxis protein
MASKRVLLIDDDRDTVVSLTQLLQYFGHQIEVAYDGVEGVAKAASFQPDVILCDIGMPGELNGLDVAETLRARKDMSNLTLVALTGYGSDSDVARCRDAGFAFHLLKPVDGIRLAQSISNGFSSGFPALSESA